MKVKVTKITTLVDAHKAIESTMHDGFKAKCKAKDLYLWEHSPSRTQLFWVECIDIPSFVSVHFVRHSAVGQQHFVKSNRSDRRKVSWWKRWLPVTRSSPVNHTMLLNAQHLIDMSRKRLCFQASEETRQLMEMIKAHIERVDSDLALYMVPNCVYRGGYCAEPRICGHYNVKRYDPSKIMEMIKK